MRIILTIAAVFLVFVSIGYFVMNERKPLPPVKTANSVDLHRYAGTWYEIARLPNHFEKGCRCVKAQYTLEDRDILVRNTCVKGSSARLKVATGRAWSVPGSNNSQLKVRFFWPFSGHYWIIYIDNNYQYAIVGSPGRKNLWFLARNPTISADVLKRLKKIAREQGFDLTRLIMTEQHQCHHNTQ